MELSRRGGPTNLRMEYRNDNCSLHEDVFDAERRRKELAAERRKKELEELAERQKHKIKAFLNSVGDRVVSFYDSSPLAVQPPKSWNPKRDVSASVLSNPLFMCSYVDDKVCGYVDDDDDVVREMQMQSQHAATADTNVAKQVQFHEGSNIPDVRRTLGMDAPDARQTLAYVKSNDQILEEICETTMANARKEFLTREALEDAISNKIEEAEAGNEEAQDELRRIFPLRFVLPTAADMREMVEVLSEKKAIALRQVDMMEANKIQAEIDDLEYQIHLEETYIRKKQLTETECVACGDKFSSREVKPGEMFHCKQCRLVFSNDDAASTTFTLAQRPLHTPMSIKVTSKNPGKPLIPNEVSL